MPTLNHDQKIARIVQSLRAHDASNPLSLRKKAVSHQVPKSGDARHYDAKVDISDLNDVLLVDVERRVCVAETGATFAQVVAATLPHGLVPLCVPELKGITVGGAVAGCSIESMSFRYGGFHDTCLEYEVVTATGEVLICTPDNENALVFQMIHGSFGTLGILARLTFRLVPATQYVHLVHETYTSIEDYKAAIDRRFRQQDCDFMDGIIHGPRQFVLCVGWFTETAPYTNKYDWLKIYYKSTATRREDYLRTADYFFRYDRGVTNVRPKSLVGRLLFGKFMTSDQWLKLAARAHRFLAKDKPTVTLDVFVPFSRLQDLLTWHDQTFAFYPLWCVPYKRVRDYEWLHESFYRGLQDQLFVDIAIYGMRQRGPDNAHRLMERKLQELNGVKTLISHNYYERDEFWTIFNRANYEAVKQRTDPHNWFRDLYQKTCQAAMGQRETHASAEDPPGE